MADPNRTPNRTPTNVRTNGLTKRLLTDVYQEQAVDAYARIKDSINRGGRMKGTR